MCDNPTPLTVSATSAPMRLLAAGVPLSLLLDLAAPDGPDSAGILLAEHCRGLSAT